MNTPVIILNWNGWDDTFECLQSILECDKNAHAWLVDNGSAVDRSPEAQAIYPGLRVLRWNDNYGWAGGYNRALRVAMQEGHEFAYLLNNDCKVTPGFLSSVLDVAKAHDRLAAVGSQIVYEEPAGFLKYDGEYHAPGTRELNESNSTKLVRSVNGAGMLVRLSAIARDGGFDERFFCYAEEEEWCKRMNNRGWFIAVAGASVIVHRCEGSDINSNAEYYRVRNQFLLLEAERERKLRMKERLALMYRHIRWANEMRRQGQRDASLTIISGSVDGFCSRFGKRQKNSSGTATRLLIYCWPFATGFFRKTFCFKRHK